MREPAKTFEDLFVWQKAHQFAHAAEQLRCPLMLAVCQESDRQKYWGQKNGIG